MEEREEHMGSNETQTGNACLVCWRSPTDRAHLIDRSLAPDRHDDPARVVYLCREHHERYDAHALDLLPHLEPRHRRELARAVELIGLVGTLERVTGASWAPKAQTVGETIDALGGVSLRV
jgi:hypothetical protein